MINRKSTTFHAVAGDERQSDRPPITERPGSRNDGDPEGDDRDFGWEDGDPADRRKDPLRK